MADCRGIQTQQLNIGYDTDLIRKICIEVKPGQIVTLIGPNGCGKTTLLKTLTGELKARGGCVYLDGKDFSSMREREAARHMSMVMTVRVNPDLMTCREVVELGRYPYTGRAGILSGRDHELVREAMAWTNVEDLAETFFQNISDGQRQRVMLARAICQEPEVLILDEPTSYLDIRHKLDLLEKIKRLAKEKQIAVLMSLHELEIAMRISDYAAALGDGRVLRTGPVREVFEEAFIRDLYQIKGMDTTLLGSACWFENKDADGAEGCTQEDAKDGAKDGAQEDAKDGAKDGAKGGAQENAKDGAEKWKARRTTLSGRARVIMIQGTMSSAGKSVIAAGLCRIFAQDGYRTAPFKSQNMALNSCVTKEGLEMGRAQVMQAECAKTEPVAAMNPILLKPVTDQGSQVIVMGRVRGNMSAAEYYARRKEYVPCILDAFRQLSESNDVVVVEGAGSPVELNLKKDDIVNMGLAGMIDAPVLLVGDIDKGGVFAQLIGTLDLLEKEERSRVKGVIVNKFRGDQKLFENGVRILEEKGRTKVVGVVPYMDVKLDDEDSLSERLQVRRGTAQDQEAQQAAGDPVQIGVIRLPHISNFTDFNPFEQLRCVTVRYVRSLSELDNPDIIILPGSKNTIQDLRWLKKTGLAAVIKEKAAKGTILIGICGGFQMLGDRIEDPEGVECGGSEEGLGLLRVNTVLGGEKKRAVFDGSIVHATGVLSHLAGKSVQGYEIHMGSTYPDGEVYEFTSGQTGYCRDNIYGSYVHGLFDRAEIMTSLMEAACRAKNKEADIKGAVDYAAFKEQQYDLLAQTLRESLDMDYLYSIMGLVKHDT